MYRIAITRPVDSNPIPPRRRRRWWFRRPDPSPTPVQYEYLHGSFPTLEAAEQSARVAAGDLPDHTGEHIGVAVLDPDGHEVGGFWAGGRESF